MWQAVFGSAHALLRRLAMGDSAGHEPALGAGHGAHAPSARRVVWCITPTSRRQCRQRRLHNGSRRRACRHESQGNCYGITPRPGFLEQFETQSWTHRCEFATRPGAQVVWRWIGNLYNRERLWRSWLSICGL